MYVIGLQWNRITLSSRVKDILGGYETKEQLRYEGSPHCDSGMCPDVAQA
jgi:hypothetical protein